MPLATFNQISDEVIELINGDGIRLELESLGETPLARRLTVVRRWQRLQRLTRWLASSTKLTLIDYALSAGGGTTRCQNKQFNGVRYETSSRHVVYSGRRMRTSI